MGQVAAKVNVVPWGVYMPCIYVLYELSDIIDIQTEFQGCRIILFKPLLKHLDVKRPYCFMPLAAATFCTLQILIGNIILTYDIKI